MTTFLIVVAGWVVSLCLHEFGHAIVAYHGGDRSVRDKGYLTLNPLKYTHPLYSLAMPLFFLMMGGIGLPGGAVYINDNMLRSRVWRSAVSVAGPIANVIVALVLCVPFWLGAMPASSENVISCAFAFLIRLQIWAVILNMLPVPPLDGFRALSPWMPLRWRDKAMRNSGLVFVGLFVLLWYVPPVSYALHSMIGTVMSALGVDPQLSYQGYWDFRFWDAG